MQIFHLLQFKQDEEIGEDGMVIGVVTGIGQEEMIIILSLGITLIGMILGVVITIIAISQGVVEIGVILIGLILSEIITILISHGVVTLILILVVIGVMIGVMTGVMTGIWIGIIIKNKMIIKKNRLLLILLIRLYS